MKGVVVLCAVLTGIYADFQCNYPLTGDEVLENAVPIATFRTSGSDFVRPNWCITHCSDRKSIKAEMNFQPSSNASAHAYEVKSYRMTNGKRMSTVLGVNGQKDDDDNTFCVDDYVASTADYVFQNFDDVETISEALNYYINRPGWAYLVYQMGPPPSIISTVNVHIDNNFCMKTYEKIVNGQYVEFQMFAGLVQS